MSPPALDKVLNRACDAVGAYLVKYNLEMTLHAGMYLDFVADYNGHTIEGKTTIEYDNLEYLERQLGVYLGECVTALANTPKPPLYDPWGFPGYSMFDLKA